MEFRNDYTDDDNYTHIDYWATDDENDEDGRTVAIVCNDTMKVYFIDNSFRNSEVVMELIKEVLDNKTCEN